MAEGGLLRTPEYFQNPDNTGLPRDYRTIWSTVASMPSSYPIVKPDENPNLNTGLLFSWGPQTQVPAPSPFWGILDAQSGMFNYENIERPDQNVEQRFPRRPSDSGIVATFAVSSSSSSSPSPQSPALSPIPVTDAQPTRPPAICLCQEGYVFEDCPHMPRRKRQRSLSYLTLSQVAIAIVKISDILNNNTTTLQNPTPYSLDPVLVGHMCKVTNHQQHTNRVDLAGFIRQLVPDTEDNTSVLYVSKINFKIDVPATPGFSNVTVRGNSERVTELEQPEENVAESQESETRQPLLLTPTHNQRQPLLPTPKNQHRRPLLRTPTPDQRYLERNIPVHNRGSGALSDSSSSSNSPNSSNYSNYSNQSLTDRYNRIRNRQSTTLGRRRATSPNNQPTNNQSPVSEHRRRRYRTINRANSTSTPRNTNNTQSSPTSSPITQSTSSDNTQSLSVDNVQPSSGRRDNKKKNRSSRRHDTRIVICGISASHNRNPSDNWRERSISRPKNSKGNNRKTDSNTGNNNKSDQDPICNNTNNMDNSSGQQRGLYHRSSSSNSQRRQQSSNNFSNSRQPNGQSHEGINLTETPPSHKTDTNESNRGNTSLKTTIYNNRRLFPRNESSNIESQSSESPAENYENIYTSSSTINKDTACNALQQKVTYSDMLKSKDATSKSSGSPTISPHDPPRTDPLHLPSDVTAHSLAPPINPQPPTLALQLPSINPQPPILALQLPSINPHLEALALQLSAFNPQPPTPALQLPSINPQPPTLALQLPSINPQPPTLAPQLPPINPHLEALALQLSAFNPQPPTPALQLPSINPQPPTLALQLPSINPQPPTLAPQLPPINPHLEALALQLSAFNPQPPTPALQLPSISPQPPTLALQLPSSVPQLPQLNRHKKVINGYLHIFNQKELITDGTVKVTHFLDDRVNFESLPARVQVTDFRVLIYGKEVILAEDADLFILAMNNTQCHLLSSNEHIRKGHLVTICYDEACPSLFRVDIVVETGNPGPVFEFKYKKRCHEE